MALLTFAVFLASVRNGWVNWDDADNFLGNPHFRGLGCSTIRWIFTGSVQDAHWIPFTWLTLSLDHAMWGMNPAGYHLTSLLIHSINALLCYVLAYRLLELGFGAGARPHDLRLAAAVANLGALHEQYRQPGQALEQYRAAAVLLPDDVTAGGRARRLAAMVASSKPVACGLGGRP